MGVSGLAHKHHKHQDTLCPTAQRSRAREVSGDRGSCPAGQPHLPHLPHHASFGTEL